MARRRPGRPRQPAEVYVEPAKSSSIAGQLDERLKRWRGLAISLAAIGAVLGFLWTGLVHIGRDPVFSGTFNEFKVEVDRKDTTVKAEVLVEVDRRLLDVRSSIVALQEAVTQRRRDLHRFQLENLEAQDAQITWSQLPQINANVAGIERQLQERPGDTWLTQRRAEVENARKNIENRQADIRARIKALREQQ